MKIMRLMEIIRKNEYFLTRDLVSEIRKTPSVSHYSEIGDDFLYDHIHHVLYHLYKRMPNWTDQGASKNTIHALYSEIGRLLHGQGIPEEEVIRVFFLIKRKICRYIAEISNPGRGDDHDLPGDFSAHINAFFDRIARAVASGYKGCTHSGDQVKTERCA